MRAIIFICLIFPFFNASHAQSLIDDKGMLAKIKVGLDHMYNEETSQADSIFYLVEKKYGNHPAVHLLYGLNIYWGDYPLMPGKEKSVEKFKYHMDQCMDMSEEILDEDDQNLEYSFYNLVSRAMLVLYYSDNGMPSKVFPHARPGYSEVKKSFDFKERFDEYYFITGLYNYYMVAYIETHPIYKPVTWVFRDGDKEEGLKDLKYASQNLMFLRAEALQYLTLIYLSFEKIPSLAVKYGKELHLLYPKNDYFALKYAEALLENHQYDKAREISDRLALFSKERYIEGSATIFQGMVEELKNNDYTKAEKLYREGIKILDPLGEFPNIMKAHAWNGLSRVYAGKDKDKSEDYYEKAEDLTPYDYVLD